mgnify:CR=1 FL=1|jgi:ABC-2 type transport system ATP-binding protein|tara:strand:- start:6563 stop:7492 length:930 start_codon:yes stop_codon:yes gene_type:complete
MAKKNVLIVKNLNKTYSSKDSLRVEALKNFDLEVREGEIFGLLGPNGAGKSTFINILAGTVIKTSGKVEVWGFNLDKNPRQAKASIGIVPQEVNVDPFFNPKKLLDLQAGLYGVKNKDRITDTILKMVSLEDHATTYTRRLSGGMKRRLMVAKALVHQPPIVILDEPTAGVDVELRKNLWDNVKNLNKNGVTIILTTHYLNEAEEMCDRIGILNKGHLVALDTTKNLINKIQTKIVNFKLNKKISINDNFLNSVRIISNQENFLSLSYEKSQLSIDQIISFIKAKNVKIIDISTDDGNLEDIFLKLTKH